MSNEKFKADFAKVLQKAGERAKDVVRASALGLQASMIERSPVDTGRFKGNWQAGVSAANLDTSATPSGDALSRTATVLQDWKPGQSIFLTNALPYAKRLEDGYSKQAPAGMVRLSVQEFKLDTAQKAK